MGRERETESWWKQVEDLERVKNVAKQAFEAQLKKMIEKMEKEREVWGKEKQAWEEKMAKEKDEKGIVEEKSSAKANDLAQSCVCNLIFCERADAPLFRWVTPIRISQNTPYTCVARLCR